MDRQWLCPLAHVVFSLSLVYGVGEKVGGWAVVGAELGSWFTSSEVCRILRFMFGEEVSQLYYQALMK